MNEHRVESLRAAWKKRKDYIGPDKKSSLYTTWRARVFTRKGKEAGFPETWETFNGFIQAMGDGWEEGKILVRNNPKLPFSKDNCKWVEKGIECTYKLGKLEYNGETKTLCEWSEIYQLNYCGVRQRYYKGKDFTPEQILFGKRYVKKGSARDYKILTEQKRRNKISCMFSTYKLRDKKRNVEFNLTREFFENEIISKPCIYCGSTEKVGCDRIDNTKGHTIDNVIPACYLCNTVRNNHFSVDEMKLLGNTIRQILDRRTS